MPPRGHDQSSGSATAGDTRGKASSCNRLAACFGTVYSGTFSVRASDRQQDTGSDGLMGGYLAPIALLLMASGSSEDFLEQRRLLMAQKIKAWFEAR